MYNTETNNNHTNETILENLYIKYRASLYQKALGILKNHEDAEDAVQYTFLAIAKNIAMLDDISAKKAKNLVHKIVEDKAIDIYRHKSHLITICTDDYRDFYQEDAMDSCLSYCIEMLPEKYKCALILKFIYGYTNEEAAIMLNISQENFRKRVYRAKVQLKAIYEKETSQ